MKATRISGGVKSALAATCFALCASAALAQDKSGAGNDGAPDSEAKEVCVLIGCNDGNRLCGTASGEKTIWVSLGTFLPGFPWSFTQTFTCYETGPVS